MKLVKCCIPAGYPEDSELLSSITVKGHIFQSYWIRDAYYEYDTLTDTWYLGVSNDVQPKNLDTIEHNPES